MERLGYEFTSMLVKFVCISYFASQIYINPTRDIFLVSQEKKSWLSLYIQVQLLHLTLNWQTNTQSFSTNPCFLRMGWDVTRNIVYSLSRKQGFVEKTCVLFCQFKFVYFLETTMYECLILWIYMMVRISLVVNSVLFWLMPEKLL